MSEEALLRYYADRADTYDEIYDVPEVQADYDRLASVFRDRLAGETVLEVACGTGHWTELLAGVADAVVGVDANREPIREATGRSYPGAPVEFLLGDAYRLPVSGAFSGGFAGFWLSHVPVGRREEFLSAFHEPLEPGATVCMFDNRRVDGLMEPHVADDRGNTYQIRDDAGEGEYRVLKNFLTGDELRDLVAPHGRVVEVEHLDHFWSLTYRLAE